MNLSLNPSEFIDLFQENIEDLEDEATFRRIISGSYFAVLVLANEYCDDFGDGWLENMSGLKDISRKWRKEGRFPGDPSDPSAHEGLRILMSEEDSEFERDDKKNLQFLWRRRIGADYKLKSYLPVPYDDTGTKYMSCDGELAKKTLKKCKNLCITIEGNT